MTIEILYFAGCPHHEPTVQLIREVLEREGETAIVDQRAITDAAMALRARFLGSPTVRIDGLDVEVEARRAVSFGLSCRTYLNAGTRSGVPPKEWIEAAVKEARCGLGSK